MSRYQLLKQKNGQDVASEVIPTNDVRNSSPHQLFLHPLSDGTAMCFHLMLQRDMLICAAHGSIMVCYCVILQASDDSKRFNTDVIIQTVDISCSEVKRRANGFS